MEAEKEPLVNDRNSDSIHGNGDMQDDSDPLLVKIRNIVDNPSNIYDESKRIINTLKLPKNDVRISEKIIYLGNYRIVEGQYICRNPNDIIDRPPMSHKGWLSEVNKLKSDIAAICDCYDRVMAILEPYINLVSQRQLYQILADCGAGNLIRIHGDHQYEQEFKLDRITSFLFFLANLKHPYSDNILAYYHLQKGNIDQARKYLNESTYPDRYKSDMIHVMDEEYNLVQHREFIFELFHPVIDIDQWINTLNLDKLDKTDENYHYKFIIKHLISKKH